MAQGMHSNAFGKARSASRRTPGVREPGAPDRTADRVREEQAVIAEPLFVNVSLQRVEHHVGDRNGPVRPPARSLTREDVEGGEGLALVPATWREPAHTSPSLAHLTSTLARPQNRHLAKGADHLNGGAHAIRLDLPQRGPERGVPFGH